MTGNVGEAWRMTEKKGLVSGSQTRSGRHHYVTRSIEVGNGGAIRSNTQQHDVEMSGCYTIGTHSSIL